MKTSLPLFITLLLLLFMPLQTLATEELAEKTNKECQHCHLDSAGGGELTAVGEGYLLSLQEASDTGDTRFQTKSAASPTRVFKLIVGFIHIFTGFFWFGTILYVHLILKPAYASQGLPRGEVRLGLISIVTMAITGIILTLYRVPSVEFFFTTRFGLLLFIKISLFMIMACSAFFVVFFIGPRLKKKRAVPTPTGGEMTEDELSFFDGSEGRQAYFAYQGKIYDVTNSRLWKNGAHMARHKAGMDLTSILSQAPHDESKVLDMPVVGTLVAKARRSTGFDHKKVFFFMAYMNLINVFLIVLVLALWKWW
ncbi:MAG: CopD family protein [Desulfuromonadales bacterium]|nr:CopD family protein [Desulfuromonadales bacterium]